MNTIDLLKQIDENKKTIKSEIEAKMQREPHRALDLQLYLIDRLSPLNSEQERLISELESTDYRETWNSVADRATTHDDLVQARADRLRERFIG